MSSNEAGIREQRFGNFDALRLLAAASVIFSHAFAITEGTESSEPFVRLLGPGNILGLYGVYVFFIISGFLISASFEKSGLRNYAIKRCLRIFPGLIVCAIATAVGGVVLTMMWSPLDPPLLPAAKYALQTWC